MNIGVLALVGLAPERVAALTAAGYAVCEAGDTVRAVLTNGRGGLSGDEMALLPNLGFFAQPPEKVYSRDDTFGMSSGVTETGKRWNDHICLKF